MNPLIITVKTSSLSFLLSEYCVKKNVYHCFFQFSLVLNSKKEKIRQLKRQGEIV